MNNEEMEIYYKNRDHVIYPVKDHNMVGKNATLIRKMFKDFTGVISYSLTFRPILYDARIDICIDHISKQADFRTSNTYVADLNDPTLISKVLLWLHDAYPQIGSDKKKFNEVYLKFVNWYEGLDKDWYEKLNQQVEEDMAKEKAKAQENDIINHPEHYTKGGIEVRDFIDSWHLNFNSGNVIKYVVRAPYKGTELQDLKKAQNYLNHLIELKEKEEANK
ncbi:DUF3310 domain-containing protein [Holdemanella sp.]|uniref:DUF3310 domain-containing protein n=1 Tax=Holdemanella sp. TaxID=1971762 RepID=UPI0027B99944|nr:DUF3310 domain-containing protein [Holdemanella sp.]